ncbi:hypothetical protein [Nonomuraea zeae]|uniref:Uncharacterized protein n=1 Tax=Nonomuraea zeae TaxID=1642303 RepID=A0A5S4GT18_9ACTN|nr:hypothetical protein [Nonomuraea zeae]TMR35681.1 hypothetical protein ETD85_13170 [Nonomuraea zeae]
MGQDADVLIVVPAPQQFQNATGISWCTASDGDSGLVITGFSEDGKEVGNLTAAFSGGITLAIAENSERATLTGSISASEEYGYEVDGQEVGQWGSFVIQSSQAEGNPAFSELLQSWGLLGDAFITVGYALKNGGTGGGNTQRVSCRALATGILLEGVRYIVDAGNNQEWGRIGDATLAYLGNGCGSVST